MAIPDNGLLNFSNPFWQSIFFQWHHQYLKETTNLKKNLPTLRRPSIHRFVLRDFACSLGFLDRRLRVPGGSAAQTWRSLASRWDSSSCSVEACVDWPSRHTAVESGRIRSVHMIRMTRNKRSVIPGQRTSANSLTTPQTTFELFGRKDIVTASESESIQLQFAKFRQI